jgi:uncharacterized protein YfdQ (DUF2303 family)
MQDTQPNIAETLARVLPKPDVIINQDELTHVVLPPGWAVSAIDRESLLAHPRRTKLKPRFSSVASFLEYIKIHGTTATRCWCDFNPQTFDLSFTAVLDDHAPGTPGWREHLALLTPDFSAEWKAWKGANTKSMPQVDFAHWIEEHEEDIASANGLPTSLQMLDMATNFVMNEERALKSAVRLQSGGMRLTYVADPDKGTTETMQMFERFGLGIPVFHGGPAWSMSARLRYRNNSGKLSFHYELIRPDRVHKAAAEELIAQIREGLGTVQLLMGKSA